jgi:RHS repeat-associated protein
VGGDSTDAASTRVRAGFTGHETDRETGLVNMGGRLYDARIGRVLQADPPFMESPFWSQGLNRYSYVFNNPLRWTDPSGYDVGDPGTFDHSEDGENGDYTYFYGDDPLSAGSSSGAGEIDTGSLHDNDDEEAETSPGQGDPADESTIGEKAESLGGASSSVPPIPTALDSLGGFGLGYMQGVVPGGTFMPMPPGSPVYQLSVALGQLVGGLWSMGVGVPLAAGGGMLTLTVGGSPVGVPAAAVGGGLAASGGVNAANAVGNIVKIADSGSGAKPPSNQTLKGGGRGGGGRTEPMTNKEAKEAAAALGFTQVKDPPFNSHGQLVFQQGNKYISPDVDVHSGGTWKIFDKHGDRMGTFNGDLSVRIGD